MTDHSRPTVIAPADDAPPGDIRPLLCLELAGPDAELVALLADAEAEREAIVRHHEARFMELSRTERRVLDDINDSLPLNARVAPFALLPPALWETELEPLLMSWGMVQVHPWLNMYLPTSEAGDPVLHLPAAPADYPGGYLEGALREARRVCAEYTAARPAPPPAGAGAERRAAWLAAEREARLHAVEGIVMLAEFLARRLFGNDIVERHEGLFGAVMKKAMGFPAGLLLGRV